MAGDDRLRPLLDVDDLDGSEARLREALRGEVTDEGQAEVLTQLARVASFREEFDLAHSLVDQADRLADPSGVAHTRVVLERGRIMRRQGDTVAALLLFEQAYEAALASGDHYIAGDAAHMCALAGDTVFWTERGLALAERYEAASYWRGTLFINLGRWQWNEGATAEALTSFEAALEAREQEPRTPFLREFARFGVARSLRALGRSAEAIPLLEQVVAWAAESDFTGPEVEGFNAELVAAYRDFGQDRELRSEDPGSQGSSAA
jgi:tetratricopeptide (TPR) repeat protein